MRITTELVAMALVAFALLSAAIVLGDYDEVGVASQEYLSE